MHVDPLAHAARAQILAPQLFGQFAVRFLVADRLMHEGPQLHESQEVASVVGAAPVRLIGRILRLQRPLARILHRQCGRDDQHLGQALLVACCEQHARHARIERQLRELPADRR